MNFHRSIHPNNNTARSQALGQLLGERGIGAVAQALTACDFFGVWWGMMEDPSIY